jgi:osmoprotectant transport system permease protein
VDLISETAAYLANPAHWQGANGIPARLLEHVELSAASLLIAIGLALPIGLWIGHTGRYTGVAVNVANLGRALPSFAVITIVLPVTAALDPIAGFYVYPTLVAMVILAVPPILVNAYAGIAAVDRDLVEVARGMGMRDRQILFGVEIPSAIGFIVTGMRSAAVQIIATATLGAIVGFGGLGRFLVDGIAQRDTGKIWTGVLMVALLAVTAELLFAGARRAITGSHVRHP